MNGGLVRLREILDQISPSERKVAQYIIDHPKQFLTLSVAELARVSEGSQAAVIRLCKSIGLKGFQELKLKIVGDLQEQQAIHYEEEAPLDSIASFIHNVSNNHIQSILNTKKMIDTQQIIKAVDCLSQAEHIYFYGVGSSNLIAQDAQNKFLRINKASFSFADPHMQVTSALNLTNRDVAVGISYSGETREMIRAFKYAKQAEAVTISITKYGANTLSRIADIPLFISSAEKEIKSGAPMTTRIAEIFLIDILFLSVAKLNYNESIEYMAKSEEVVRELKK